MRYICFLLFPSLLTSNIILAFASSDKFSYGDGTEIDVFRSCSVLVGNRMLIFGGTIENRQVSVVYPWGVYRIQALPFRFHGGQCHFTNNTVHLCFDGYADKSCRKT